MSTTTMHHHDTTSRSGMSMTMSPTSSSMSGMAMVTSMPPSHHSESMMGMDSMAMVFFTSAYTPLFSNAWTPTTVGEYTGTCVFLIVLAAVFRALLALRAEFYHLLAVFDARRDRGTGFDLYGKSKGIQQQWRAKEAVLLASLDVVLAGVGYLLFASLLILRSYLAHANNNFRMIAVMTMNVGYFMSVLAGVFVGSFGFGRFTANSAGC